MIHQRPHAEPADHLRQRIGGYQHGGTACSSPRSMPKGTSCVTKPMVAALTSAIGSASRQGDLRCAVRAGTGPFRYRRAGDADRLEPGRTDRQQDEQQSGRYGDASSR